MSTTQDAGDDTTSVASTETTPPGPPVPPTDDVTPFGTRLPMWLRYVVVACLLASAVLIAGLVPSPTPARPVFLALHLISVIVGFGAVLAVDWTGLLWLAGRRTLAETLRFGAGLSPMIWLGLAGLLVSGSLLKPEVSHFWTAIKMALVLIAMVNGTTLSAVRRGLAETAGPAGAGRLTRHDWWLIVGSTVVSQACWWGATLIGFVSNQLS